MVLTRRLLVTGTMAGLAAPRLAQAATQLHWMTLAGHAYVPPIFAAREGVFTRAGLDIAVSIATQAPALLPAVVGGSIQIGVSTPAQVALASQAGLDIAALAGASVQTRTHQTTAAVIRPGSHIRQPRDFIGKRVGIPGLNGSFHLMFEQYLLTHGVQPKQVIFVEAGFAQMGDLLKSGQADAVLALEPFLSRLVASGAGRRLNYYEITGKRVYDSVYICRRSWAAANRATTAAIRQALMQAIAEMTHDPAKSAAVEAAALKLPLAIITRLGPPEPDVTLLPADMQVWIDIARKVGLLTKPVNAASLIAA